MVESGGVGVFVELLFSDIDQLQKNATMVIGNFARDESLAEEIIQRGGGEKFRRIFFDFSGNLTQIHGNKLGNHHTIYDRNIREVFSRQTIL